MNNLNTNTRSRIQLLMAVAMVVAMVAAIMVCPFAATITDGIDKGMKSIYELICSVTMPIATVVFAWNGIKMFVGGQRNMEQAKMNLLICCLVIGLIWFAPTIINTVGSWFQGGATWNWTGGATG